MTWYLLASLAALVSLLIGSWLSGRAGALRSAAGIEAIWQSDLSTAVALARQRGKPLHVHFTRASAPLAVRMDATLEAPPVAHLAQKRFVNLRLDSLANAGVFRDWLGGAGLLGSCILDFSAGEEPDVVAVLAGYVEPERYVEFLDATVRSLPRLRGLREEAATWPAANLELGELYAAQRSQPRAHAAFLAALSHRPLRASALEHLARLDVAVGQVARARRELDEARALPQERDLERYVLTEALVLSAERRVSAAVALLLQQLPALTTPGELDQSLLLLGALEHELGRNVDALAHLGRLRQGGESPALARAASDLVFHVQHPQAGHSH
jgi:tetratricopeptide (TPR) repeat protein